MNIRKIFISIINTLVMFYKLINMILFFGILSKNNWKTLSLI